MINNVVDINNYYCYHKSHCNIPKLFKICTKLRTKIKEASIKQYSVSILVNISVSIKSTASLLKLINILANIHVYLCSLLSLILRSVQ